MNRRRTFQYLSVFCFSLLLCGCGEQTEGYVHVDNGSDELIIVYVDGRQKARIGPGRCRKLTLPVGDRAFKVTRGDETIYEATHKIDLGNRPFRRPTYILNPDQSNRYCKVEVIYHDEDFGQSDLADLITMISNRTDEGEEADNSGEPEAEPEMTEHQKKKANRALVRKYREISRRLVTMGDDAFFQIEDVGNLFKPMPSVVYSRQSGDQKRTTLARIPTVLHDYLAEATVLKEPTRKDLEKLKVAEEVAISYVPFR